MLPKTHLKHMLRSYKKETKTINDQLFIIQCFLNTEECHNVGLYSPIFPDYGFSNEEMEVIIQCRIFVLQKSVHLETLKDTIQVYVKQLTRRGSTGQSVYPDEDNEHNTQNAFDLTNNNSESYLIPSLSNFLSILMQIHGGTYANDQNTTAKSLMTKITRILRKNMDGSSKSNVRLAIMRLIGNFKGGLYSASEFATRLDYLGNRIKENLQNLKKLSQIKLLPFSMPKSVEKILAPHRNRLIMEQIYDPKVKYDICGENLDSFSLYRFDCRCMHKIIGTDFEISDSDNDQELSENTSDDSSNDHLQSDDTISNLRTLLIPTEQKTLKPFTIITDVEPESIGFTIGLKAFDKFIQFGSLTKSNFKNARDMNREVKKFIGKDLHMTILRNGIELDVFLPKSMWRMSDRVGVGLSTYYV